MVKERNPVVSILLTIVTCGIYGLYWYCTITDDVDVIAENPNKRNGVVVILLSIVTCGIYTIYWWYQNGQMMEEANKKKGVNGNSSAVLFLILALLFPIANYIIVQMDINKYANGSNTMTPPTPPMPPQQPTPPANF